MGRMTGKISRINSAYRSAHHSLIQNGEAVVASGGAEREAERIRGKFSALMNVWNEMLWVSTQFSLSVRATQPSPPCPRLSTSSWPELWPSPRPAPAGQKLWPSCTAFSVNPEDSACAWVCLQYRIISIYDQGGSSLINPTALMLHIPLLRPGNPLRAPAGATTAQTMVNTTA